LGIEDEVSLTPQVSKQFHHVGRWLIEAFSTFLHHLTLSNLKFCSLCQQMIDKSPPTLPTLTPLTLKRNHSVGRWLTKVVKN
jgi:hypothetical protein